MAELETPELETPIVEEQSNEPEVIVADPAPAPEAAPPEFVPELKYDFNGQQKELDAFWRPLAKDKESNQKVIDAIQKLDAHESYKSQVGEMKETVDTVKQLSSMFAEGKHERVLQALGYTDEMLMDIVRSKLEHSKLPPEQKAAFDKNRQLEVANEKLLADNQKYQSEGHRELARVTEYEVDMELGKAEVSKIVKAYDTHYGSGEFKKLVGQRGDAMVRGLGRHVKPADVIQGIMREYAPFLNSAPAASVEKPKVIPQLAGGNGSPGKQAVTSIADLRKLRSQMIGEE